MTMQNRIQKILDEFSKIPDWEARYKRLIDLGKELPSMDEQNKTDANKVRGCQSQVWLWANMEGEKIVFQADSDASITKGIVALLVNVYSGSTPDEILVTKPDFLTELGIREHLSMSRANGLNAILKQITIYAMAFKAKASMKK